MSSYLGAMPSFTSSEESIDTGSIVGIGKHTIEALNSILDFDNNVHLQPIKENINYAHSMLTQADVLFQKQHITEDDYTTIVRTAKTYIDEGSHTIAELTELFPQLKSTLNVLIERVGHGAKEGSIKQISDRVKQTKEVKDETEAAYKQASTVYEKAKDAVTSLQRSAKTAVAKLKQRAEAYEALQQSGASAEELAIASADNERENELLQTLIGQAETSRPEYEATASSLEEAMNKARQIYTQADLAFESARVYEGSNFLVGQTVRTISNAIGAYTDPIKKMAFSLKRASKLVLNGYESFIASLVKDGDVGEFIQQVNNITAEKAAEETGRVKTQLQSIKSILSTAEEGDIDAMLVAECAKWMSPSWRLAASLDEDMIYFAQSLNISKFTDFFILLGKSGYIILQATIKVPLMLAAKALERVLGELAATAIIDVTEAVIVGISELSTRIFAPEVMAVLLAFYSVVDIFRVHNFWEWLNDIYGAVLTDGITDKIYSLRLLQYPVESKLGDKDWKEDPSSVLRIDTEQFKTTIDFWGAAYTNERNILDSQERIYEMYPSYEAVIRVPGKYINPDHHPLDSDVELDTSKQIEEALLNGSISDETGQAIGPNAVIPYIEGAVRNFATFPVYKNNITWPDRNGTALQTKGQFNKDSVDPYIAQVWEHWVTSGAWGPAFNHPTATYETRQAAMAINREDYANYLNPSRFHPFAWTDVHTWVSNNKGKRTLIDQILQGNKYSYDVGRKYERYLDLLDGNEQLAMKHATEDIIWELYVTSTQRSRTLWGYITKMRTLLLVETQQYVTLMAGTRKSNIWKNWLSTVAKAGVPLNTNRYKRLAFVGRLNQLVYATTDTRRQQLEDELKQVGGDIIENILITTGSVSNALKQTWAKAIDRSSVYTVSHTSSFDFPIFFGDLHCRIILVSNPRQTCFVVFRGTTNPWEWVVDLDFTSAEYGEIVQGAEEGSYEMKMLTRSGGKTDSISDFLFGSPDRFAVHRGFLRAWLAFKPTVIKQLKRLYDKYTIQDVIVTGHSLGAGITQIACLEIPSLPVRKPVNHIIGYMGGLQGGVEYRRPHAYMYASPAVGDDRFSWHFVSQTGESMHAYIDGDIFTMIPPMLLPSNESWGKELRDSLLTTIVNVTSSTPEGAMWHLLARVFRGFNLPIMPQDFTTSEKWDWTKAITSLGKVNLAYNKYRAFHGGGLFIRMDSDMSGTFIEQPYDPGSTEGTLTVTMTGILDHTVISARHSIDNIVSTIDKIVDVNPDIFDEIDRNSKISWNDIEKPSPPPRIDPVLPSRIKDMLEGKVVAIGQSIRHYAPFHMVAKEDVIPESIVEVLDLGKIRRSYYRRRRRLKIRKITDGDYHGY